jgi:predicted PhzF superfamily epimerase YddE/YHI9
MPALMRAFCGREVDGYPLLVVVDGRAETPFGWWPLATRKMADGRRLGAGVDGYGIDAATVFALAKRHRCHACLVSLTDTPERFDLRFFAQDRAVDVNVRALLGAAALLWERGLIAARRVRFSTLGGIFSVGFGRDDDGRAIPTVYLPGGTVAAVDQRKYGTIRDALGLAADDIANAPIVNACLAEPWTFVPLRRGATLRDLTSVSDKVSKVCADVGSVGIYPYVAPQDDASTIEAKPVAGENMFPKHQVPGSAASALPFALFAQGRISLAGQRITVVESRSPERVARIETRLAARPGTPLIAGCFVSGKVALVEDWI